MPSDFIALFSEDLDLTASRVFDFNESGSDLLPKAQQSPASTLQKTKIMSQTSGGEAGTTPSASLTTDAFSLTMEGPHSAFSTPSSSIMLSTSSPSDQTIVRSISDDQEDNRSCRVVPEIVGAESGHGNGSSEPGTGRGVSSIDGQLHHQLTLSKRRTVLNISPPPHDLFDDSLMSCQDEASRDSEQSNSIWMDDSLSNFSMMSTVSYNDNTEVPRKSRKRTPRQRPGPKAVPAVEANMDVFDADSAKGPHFVLSQLGQDNKTGSKGSSDGHQSANQKGGALSMQFPPKSEGKELKILVQPETQHRARYLTEGSRGSVKDRSQQGFPTVKLEGVNEPVVLQVFVGNDNGRVRPHRFYQACRVTGRNTTACKEVDIDGTTVIEVPLDPSTKMTLAVDCVGILKLRNADVEARIGVAGSKKKSTRARLVFRVNIPRSDGSMLTLQTPSCQILCTQPAGLPEILKKSLHSCSVRGGEEIFIIGKNFLKDTKVIFQEHISDESSWKAEAQIDMELFHQNHLIAKVPPYQDLNITTAIHVGIYLMTNAGRSHDIQPFTYTPDMVKQDVLVKKEIPSPVKTCTIDEPIKDGGLIPSRLTSVKSEDVTPMEVTSNLQSSRQFKTPELCPAQQSPDLAAGHLNPNRPFPTNLPQAAVDQDNNQTSAFTNTESLSTIHKQDIATTVSFSDSLLQQRSQQFLLEPRDGLAQERPGSGSGGGGGLCTDPSPQQPELPLFQPDEVTQLEEAVRQLKAKGFCSLPIQSDNSMSEQQQQQHMQQQPPIQKQVQQQQMQQQQLQHQQQQHQQVLDSLQQQLFQPSIPMQRGLYQNVSQGKNIEQQGSPQGVVSNPGSLFQQVQQQQQQQQQAPFFQQANNLLSIQTNFLQQTPPHQSPPIFHNPSPLAESQDPQGALFQKASQEQVQVALFQNNMNVLQSPEQQPSNPGLFLPQTSLPTQLTANSSQQQQQNQHQQQQQLAFLNALQSPVAEPQSVFQSQNQLSPIQQISPLEQQQQQPPQPQAHTQPPQQASLFHPTTNTLPPGQQQQQTGLLFCTNTMSSPDQASSLIFNSQGQMPPLTSSNLVTQESQNPALLFSQSNMVTVNQQDRTEPMALGNPTHTQRQVLFQEQQPMQLGSSSASQQEQPVGLFMPQSNMASLQGGLAQELAQSAMFGPQNSVGNLQTTASSPVQRPGTMFQTAVSGSLNPPSQSQQPGLFLFGLQNGCSQLINTPGNTVSDQIIAISQSGQNQRENDVHIQNLLSQSLSQPRTVQNSMSGPENMEKMDDLLVSLQESNSTLTHSYSLISQRELPRDQ